LRQGSILGKDKYLISVLRKAETDFVAHPVCCSMGVKVKINFTLEQATKAQRGSRGITPLFH
jgi:hypothetical protein